MNPNAQLRKAYKRRFNSLNKNFFKNTDSGLITFVEHLKFKRDNLVLQADNEKAIASLIAAIAEFEAYQTSEDPSKKEFHWSNFCDFIKLNMEEWQVANDTV